MKTKNNVRKLTVTAILSAMGFVLMLFNFSIPLVPDFLKLDFSDLPALIAAFSLGPLSGVAVCFFKNLLHLLNTSTAGIGELSNFVLGSTFVLVSGFIYKYNKNFKGAVLGAFSGALCMALVCVFTNYFIVYPLYSTVLGLSSEMILGMYRAILPGVKNMFSALVIFNLPFTFVKGMISVVITFLIYKKISPIIKGEKH